jgi:hypothetical protein
MNHTFRIFLMWIIGVAFTFGIMLHMMKYKNASITTIRKVAIGIALLWPIFWLGIAVWTIGGWSRDILHQKTGC